MSNLTKKRREDEWKKVCEFCLNISQAIDENFVSIQKAKACTSEYYSTWLKATLRQELHLLDVINAAWYISSCERLKCVDNRMIQIWEIDLKDKPKADKDYLFRNADWLLARTKEALTSVVITDTFLLDMLSKSSEENEIKAAIEGFRDSRITGNDRTRPKIKTTNYRFAKDPVKKIVVTEMGQAMRTTMIGVLCGVLISYVYPDGKLVKFTNYADMPKFSAKDLKVQLEEDLESMGLQVLNELHWALLCTNVYEATRFQLTPDSKSTIGKALTNAKKADPVKVIESVHNATSIVKLSSEQVPPLFPTAFGMLNNTELSDKEESDKEGEKSGAKDKTSNSGNSGSPAKKKAAAPTTTKESSPPNKNSAKSTTPTNKKGSKRSRSPTAPKDKSSPPSKKATPLNEEEINKKEKTTPNEPVTSGEKDEEMDITKDEEPLPEMEDIVIDRSFHSQEEMLDPSVWIGSAVASQALIDDYFSQYMELMPRRNLFVEYDAKEDQDAYDVEDLNAEARLQNLFGHVNDLAKVLHNAYDVLSTSAAAFEAFWQKAEANDPNINYLVIPKDILGMSDKHLENLIDLANKFEACRQRIKEHNRGKGIVRNNGDGDDNRTYVFLELEDVRRVFSPMALIEAGFNRVRPYHAMKDFSVIDSPANGAFQFPHTDALSRCNKKVYKNGGFFDKSMSYSIEFALYDNFELFFFPWDAQGKNFTQRKLNLHAGEAVIFKGNVYHSGSKYTNAMNKRGHVFAESPEYPIFSAEFQFMSPVEFAQLVVDRESAQDNNVIIFDFQSMDDVDQYAKATLSTRDYDKFSKELRVKKGQEEATPDDGETTVPTSDSAEEGEGSKQAGFLGLSSFKTMMKAVEMRMLNMYR